MIIINTSIYNINDLQLYTKYIINHYIVLKRILSNTKKKKRKKSFNKRKENIIKKI